MTGPGGTRYTIAPGPEWTGLAAGWPVRLVTRETEPGHLWVEKEHLERDGRPVVQAHLVCGNCDQSVICLAPDAGSPGYLLDVAQMQAGVLAHIRQCHEPSLSPTASAAV